MRKVKIQMQDGGIEICLGQSEAISKIKGMNASTWVDQAFQGTGYVGFNLKTSEIVEDPGPTTIKLFELPKNSKQSILELHNHFRQDWQCLQIDIKKRVNSFYAKNCQIT